MIFVSTVLIIGSQGYILLYIIDKLGIAMILIIIK